MVTPRLWTPIANALDAYKRRVAIEPGADYEHIWRLIHIQEALAVTLTSLMVTRLATVPEVGQDNLNSVREALTGLKQVNGSDDDIEDAEQSPWSGSIGSWIELLRRFGREPLVSGDPFLDDLSAYLTSTPDRELAFASEWAKIAPVAATFRDAKLDRVGRLGAINSFRNKLAHVPIAQRLLSDLHSGLRVETFDGLTDQFDPSKHAAKLDFSATKFRTPLTGVLLRGRTFITGASEVGIDDSISDSTGPAQARFLKAGEPISWPVAPFFRIDGEAKAALLFQVSDLAREPGAADYSGEYHRFAAEADPVQYQLIPSSEVSFWIPRPPVSKPSEASDVPAIATSGDCAEQLIKRSGSVDNVNVGGSLAEKIRTNAEEAVQRRDNSEAAKHFDELKATGDTLVYNDVARMKHGSALWRAAESPGFPQSERTAELRRAADILLEAERHRDSKYSARAAYEGSKALWHLWRATNDPVVIERSLEAANRAVQKSPYEAFVSWQARVASDLMRAYPPVQMEGQGV